MPKGSTVFRDKSSMPDLAPDSAVFLPGRYVDNSASTRQKQSRPGCLVHTTI